MTDKVKEILNKIKINNDAIEKIKGSENMTILEDKEHLLKIRISGSLANYLYCENLLDNDEMTEINILDVLYCNGQKSYKHAYKLSEFGKDVLEREELNIDNLGFATKVICFLLTKLNEEKYKNIKSIHDIKEPIPFPVFMKVINSCKIPVKFNEFSGYLDELRVQEGMSGQKTFAWISIVSRGIDGYVQGFERVELPNLEFISSIEELGFTEVKKGDKNHKLLTNRGKRYTEINDNPKFCEYHGEGFTPGYRKDDRHRIDSRVMIDIEAFKLLNSNYDEDWFVGYAAYSTNLIGKTLPEDELWRCSPYVYGFAFNNKIWCKMNLNDLSEITFADNAFEKLIIPEQYKNLFIASLTNDMPSFDVMSDKGEGKIFLLHGTPGVGKTLTAESVAEHLQKPLYFVSVGELGVNPSQLEDSLSKVMRVAESWDAVVLLDEVDVFAINREGASIERNAMTAIFLRMLERYSGVMFMTTNLKDNLDPAFISRATACIEYKPLSVDVKKNIWTSILDKITNNSDVLVEQEVYENVEDYASHELNGRIIKNAARLAYTLSLTEDKILTDSHIRQALEFVK